MPERESSTEVEARQHLERILERELQRVAPSGMPSADYTFALSRGLVAGVEVKELASPDWLQLSAGHRRHETERETDQLNLHWRVALDAELVSERLAPVPNYPEDNEEQIEAYAAMGFTTVRKAERVAGFKRARDESLEPIRIKGIIDDLLPELTILEARGIRTTRGGWPSDADSQRALQRIAHRTRGAICMGSDARPEAGIPSGLFIHLAFGYVRTGRADTIAERVEAWFESQRSDNLIVSLNRPEYDERHAVLVLNSLEPEWWSSAGKETFVPERLIAIPETVDVVWVILGPRVLRYSISEGWREF